jgi:hypothetical protein
MSRARNMVRKIARCLHKQLELRKWLCYCSVGVFFMYIVVCIGRNTILHIVWRHD